MSRAWNVPLVVRGETIETDDVAAHVDKLTIGAQDMRDLTALRCADVLEYLDALSTRLDPASNAHIREAYEMSRSTSRLTDTTLHEIYRRMPDLFRRESVEHRARSLLPQECLDEWVESPTMPSSSTIVRARAFGARTLHIIAGNTPAIAPVTILNNALTRGDALIKSPANDPLTAVAIARTMLEMAPTHPLTRHVAVAYWKGGDAQIERHVYHARHIEKIVAWGGHASIRHVMRELPVGVDLITLDPKQGCAIIEAAALLKCSYAELREVAARLARDIGSMNQEACFNTRLVYLLATTADETAAAQTLGELTYEAMLALPPDWSTSSRAFDPELKAEIDALRLCDAEHSVIGGRHGEGAIIVSPGGHCVEFAARLGCRVANLIVVHNVDEALAALGSWAQTVGVYPDTLKQRLRDALAIHGVQRIVSLGGATLDPDLATAQDGMELLRRMCKWVVDETAP